MTPVLAVFEEVLRHLPAPRPSRLHGVAHSRHVAENGATLCPETEGADPAVVGAFAALHDACRRTDGRDPEHGARAATLARELHAAGLLPLDPGQLATLAEALEGHDRGETSTDPTVAVCWDADRLDLPRIGVRVQPRLLSTEAARATLAAGPGSRSVASETSRPAQPAGR